VSVVELKITPHARDARANVFDDGCRHIETTVPQEPKPESEIDVLGVAEEVLVEGACLHDVSRPVESGGRAGSENFAGGVVRRAVRTTVTVPPGQTAHVVNIAHTVETRRIVRVEHAAAEEAVI
jgi:hypothetical protein